ncbi:MAG: hypothetical protein ALAOOOJD_01387 [bacterium]|nr:hypothetical protein [bacterium]
MNDAPVISIVIPTRNRRVLLAEAINSILAQTFVQWELVVVDDASEDDTFAYVQQLGDKRVKILRLEQHAERSAARNTGLDVAQGKFILFLDDDDLLPAAGLQTHVDAFARYPSAIASIGNIVRFDEHGAQMSSKFVRRHYLRNLWPDILLGWSPVCSRCLFLTAAIKSLHGWNTTYSFGEDHELWLRLSRRGLVILVPGTVCLWRVHSGQWRPPKQKVRKLLTKMRQRAVQELDGKERQVAERIFAAREQRRLARDQYHSAKTFQALRACFETIRLFPGILQSPLTRPGHLRRMINCLLGGQKIVRPMMQGWQRLTQKEKIDFSARSIVRSSDGRTHLKKAPGRVAPFSLPSEEDE